MGCGGSKLTGDPVAVDHSDPPVRKVETNASNFNQDYSVANTTSNGRPSNAAMEIGPSDDIPPERNPSTAVDPNEHKLKPYQSTPDESMDMAPDSVGYTPRSGALDATDAGRSGEMFGDTNVHDEQLATQTAEKQSTWRRLSNSVLRPANERSAMRS